MEWLGQKAKIKFPAKTSKFLEDRPWYLRTMVDQEHYSEVEAARWSLEENLCILIDCPQSGHCLYVERYNRRLHEDIAHRGGRPSCILLSVYDSCRTPLVSFFYCSSRVICGRDAGFSSAFYTHPGGQIPFGIPHR
jgi:hypothetical protein